MDWTDTGILISVNGLLFSFFQVNHLETLFAVDLLSFFIPYKFLNYIFPEVINRNNVVRGEELV